MNNSDLFSFIIQKLNEKKKRTNFKNMSIMNKLAASMESPVFQKKNTKIARNSLGFMKYVFFCYIWEEI